jgi:hypothetical protein
MRADGLYGMVHVLKGKLKGRIGHYDDDDEHGAIVQLPGGQEITLPYGWLEPLEDSEDVIIAWQAGRPYASLGRDARWKGRTTMVESRKSAVWAVNVLIRPGPGVDLGLVITQLEAVAGASSASGSAIRPDGSRGATDVSWCRDTEAAALELWRDLEHAAHTLLPHVELEILGPEEFD